MTNPAPLAERIGEVLALADKATPGPWFWRVGNSSRRYELSAPHGGGTTVMDFVRKGMQHAMPRFGICLDGGLRGTRGGILLSVDELIERDPKGLLTHPDANLIAAAPEMADLLRECAAEIERLRAAYVELATSGSASEISSEHHVKPTF